MVLELRQDIGAAAREGSDHPAFLGERALVVVGSREVHARGALESVSAGRASRREAEGCDRHHVRSAQRHEAVGRPHELHGGFAVGELIAHHLGDRKPGERLVERRLQRLGKRHRGGRRVHEEGFALAVDAALESRRVDSRQTQGLQLLLERGGGLPGGVQADRDRHELYFEGARLRGASDLPQAHRKPARGRELERLGAGVGEPPSGEAVPDADRKGRAEARELLAEELDQERRAHAGSRRSIGKPSRSRESW